MGLIVGALGHLAVVLPLLSLIAAMSGCGSGQNPPPPGVGLGTPIRTAIAIGPAGSPEPNLTSLIAGPRGLVFGCTEENGWIVILDPITGRSMQWNAGHTSPTPTSGAYEGDITDLTAWEESGRIVIIACQAYPAAIYRYSFLVDASATGSAALPEPGDISGECVYENPEWARIHSVARSAASGLLLAGSHHGEGAIVASRDGGFTWEILDYMSTVPGLNVDGLKAVEHSAWSVSGLHWIDGTWFACLFNSFVLEAEIGLSGTQRHYANAVFYSRDEGASWALSTVTRTSPLPDTVQAAVDQDRAKGRLPEPFYGLINERMQSLVRGTNGRLYATTTFDYTTDLSGGGRVYASADGGTTWTETARLEGFTDANIIALPNGLLVAGTMTKLEELPTSQAAATADLWVSDDNGQSFSHFATVASTTSKSTIHPGFYVIGVASMAYASGHLVVGTVNESAGGSAEILLVPVT
ncbi:MAG TPA: sialidase family protein [Armatimonadota bacterium]|nr:sialidase family protein [Armatimonadota bacterium]HQK94621.1 sialidase family protein [Armatimonadota bacterium]